MEPQTQAVSGVGSLDPQAVNLAKAIRQSESGGNFSAPGKSGEYGAYQYTDNTWAKDSAAAGVNVPLKQATPEQQNQVAYTKIKSLKDKGYNIGQTASVWNAGEGEPNAYTGKFSDGSPSVGTNKQGVHFDVPKYAKSVATAYQTLKGGGQVQADPNNPSSVASTQNASQPDNRDWLQKTEDFVGGLAKNITEPLATLAARPYQLAATTLGGQTDEQAAHVPILSDIYGDMPVPRTGTDLAKDVGRGAQVASLAMPVGGIARGIGMGAVAGAGAGLENSGTAGGAIHGGLIGGAVGGIGGALAKTLGAIPKRIANTAFGGKLSAEELDQALATKTIGTKASLLAQSEGALNKYGNTIDGILKEKVASNPTLGYGSNAVHDTLEQFPEYTGKIDKMITKIKSLISAGNTAGNDRGTILNYIDKIQNGTANIYEKNVVRSALDHATSGGYAKLAKAINPSAGHDIGMTFANSLRNEVQTVAPETQTIFSEFSKEMAIKKALNKMVNKSSGGLLRWKDIYPFLVGNAVGGPVSGLVGVGVERAAENPAVQFGVAKTIQGTARAVNPLLNRSGLIPLAYPKSQ